MLGRNTIKNKNKNKNKNLILKIKFIILRIIMSLSKEDFKEYLSNSCKSIGYKDNKKNKVYLYGIRVDGKPCIKPGITTKLLLERCTQYWFNEHSDQRLSGPLFLFTVFECDQSTTYKDIEGLIKNKFKINLSPLHSSQHGNTEQYLLRKNSDELIIELIENLKFFCEKVYKSNDIKDQILNLFNNSDSLDITPRLEKKIESEDLFEDLKKELIGKKLLNNDNDPENKLTYEILLKVKETGLKLTINNDGKIRKNCKFLTEGYINQDYELIKN